MFPGKLLVLPVCWVQDELRSSSALFAEARGIVERIDIEGQPVQIRSVQHAVRHGIGYVPEDRITEGLFLEQSIGRNIIVSILERLANLIGIMKADLTSREIQKFIDYLRIKTPSSLLPVQSLSGGNQQRVVLAKWLATKGKILILNGPTVGVDIGSKMDIHHTLRELAKQGMGIVMISDDIPELLQNCNRIFLMHKGRFIDELVR